LSTAGVLHLAAHGGFRGEPAALACLGRVCGTGSGCAFAIINFLVTALLGSMPKGPIIVVLIGLAMAFLERGSAQLIASVLPVPDAPTAPLMAALHERLAAGTPPARALAEAQSALLPLGGEALAAAAGFVCIGAGTRPITYEPEQDHRAG
jgi:CHAT domain-containing protein